MTGLTQRIRAIHPHAMLRVACGLTLVGLALMVWSMIDPSPLPVMLAMSVGQLVGTAAFALYGVAVVKDLRRIRRQRRDSQKSIVAPPREAK